MKAVV
jgi:hypothetical protein